MVKGHQLVTLTLFHSSYESALGNENLWCIEGDVRRQECKFGCEESSGLIEGYILRVDCEFAR